MRPYRQPRRPVRRSRRGAWLLAAASIVLAVVLVGAMVKMLGGDSDEAAWPDYSADALTFERRVDPAGTVVRNGEDIVAVFTDGARTALLSGPERTLSEAATTDATVTTRAVVRLIPQAWQEGEEDADWFQPWLDSARTTTGDIIDIATQYRHDAPDQFDERGVRFAGSAVFGPPRDGEIGEFSDFNDYLGIDWTYSDGTVREADDPDRYGALDCSGFVRMVYGYRAGYPLEFTDPTGTALPRRAVMMAENGPGVVVVSDITQHPDQIDRLQPGDLLFFNVDALDGPQVDHVAIYLGIDSTGHRRFISSRQRNNGPTLGDLGGDSVLDGDGHYAQGFRMARRL